MWSSGQSGSVGLLMPGQLVVDVVVVVVVASCCCFLLFVVVNAVKGGSRGRSNF